MIKKIGIRGFKALQHMDRKDVGKLTLLTGINGRGKSTFLQSLLLISQSLRSANSSLMNLCPIGDWVSLGVFKELINNDNDNKVVVFEFETTTRQEEDVVLTYAVNSQKESIGELISCVVNGEESLFEETESDINSEQCCAVNGDDSLHYETELNYEQHELNKEEKPLSSLTYHDLTELNRLQNMYYVASDRYAAKGEELLNEALRPNYIGSQGEYVLNVLSHCSMVQLNQLKDAMSQILDGAYIEFKTDSINNRISLFIDSTDNGKNFRPVNVGYGYSYAISLLLSVILANDNDVLIIENPEAHLHPQAQARLMEYLVRVVNEKNVQCFIETHSDHIVNGLLVSLRENRIGLDDAQILFFDRKIKDDKSYIEVSNLELTKYGRVRKPPKGFCDQYGIDLRKLI